MSWLLHPPLSTVFRRRENGGEPVDDRRLRARLDAGEVVRIAPGSFVAAAEWRTLSPMSRHAQRVWEAAARLRPPQVFSGFAAAALFGADILGPWPATIDVTVPRSGGGRSTGLVRRRGADLDAHAVMPWGSHAVTTPLQTAVDLIAGLRFTEGVAVADRFLWSRRAGGPLVTLADLRAAAASRAGRGSARALRAAEFATPLADSIRESHSRVVIRMLGFPDPELQARFVLDRGREAFTDFFWPDHRHIGEFDGAGKYRDPGLLRGRTAEQVLLAEKDREDELRRQVRAFSRWRVPALRQPAQLWDILTRAGLPSSRPRPGR